MYPISILSNERGSALVVSLLMLVVLTLIGISATTTTNFELEISGNDKLQKMAFYQADGASVAGAELLEQNIEVKNWTKTVVTEVGNIEIMCAEEDGMGNCIRRDHYLNGAIGAGVEPADINRHMVIPAGSPVNDPAPHTNILLGEAEIRTQGASMLLAAGYEGMGKGIAGGGAWSIYDVRARHEGVRNSTAVINLQWRHVM